MRLLRALGGLCFAVCVALNVMLVSAHEEQVILVGCSAAGELKVDADFVQPVELPLSIFPGIPGYATGQLALHSAIFDDPTNDFFQLSVATDFRLVLVAKDPGIEVWNGSGYMDTNEMYSIGPSPFDVHPIWNILSGATGNAYSLTLKLRDLNGVYPDSEPFVLRFTPVQPPIQISLTPSNSLHATLLWTTNALNWELQSTTSLSSPNWVTLTNSPSVAGTNFSLNIDTAGTQQFFRLHRL